MGYKTIPIIFNYRHITHLIEIPLTATCPPAPLQVRVPGMVLLATLWLSHFVLEKLNQNKFTCVNCKQMIAVESKLWPTN